MIENPPPQTTKRPIYTPEPFDTEADIVEHLRSDVAWLEGVIRMAREELESGYPYMTLRILNESGVNNAR